MRITAVHRRRTAGNRERGFTLVELLVVVAIIGILSAIALSQFSVYKKKAIDSEMVHDLHSARTAMENYYEQNDYTYEGATVDLLKANHGFRETDGVELRILSPLLPTNYSLRACAPSGNYPSFRFDSDGGSMVGEDVDC